MSVARPLEVAVDRPGAQRMGFFTDTTVCIGCKACEVACKQWNDLPSDGSSFRRGGSYDNTGSLGAATWRHVRFVEQLGPSDAFRADAEARLAAGDGGQVPAIPAAGAGAPSVAELGGAGAGVAAEEVVDLVSLAERGPMGDDWSAGRVGGNGGAPGEPKGGNYGAGARNAAPELDRAVADMDRWVFMSDVCKHCSNAGCLDACPTGALIRTEFETVFLQSDVCNGCGYCIPSCPFGVVDRDTIDGRAGKCTLCYDRLQDGLEPACAKACPTDSIQFGPYEALVATARGRVSELHRRGVDNAYLYGAGDEPGDEIAGGLGAFFLLTLPPERVGLPAQADSPIQENLLPATGSALAAGVLAAVGVAASFLWSRRG